MLLILRLSTEFTYSFTNFPLCTVDQNIENIVLKVFLIGKISMLMNVRIVHKRTIAADFEWYTESWKWENIKSIN